MVAPVRNIYIVAHFYGSELDLQWNLPEWDLETEANHRIILLKKTDQQPFDQSIADNFFVLFNDEEKKTELAAFCKANKIFYVAFYSKPTAYSDMICTNKLVYYYRVYVQNIENKELSAPAEIEGTPEIKSISVIFDGKILVERCIKNLFKSLVSQNGEKLDVPIMKEYNLITSHDQWGTIHRHQGEIVQRFYGNVLRQYRNEIRTGHIIQETIQLTIFSRGNVDRLHELFNTLRANEHIIRRYIMYAGAIEVLVTYLGESLEDREQSDKLVYTGIMISILSESHTKINLDSGLMIPEVNVIDKCKAA